MIFYSVGSAVQPRGLPSLLIGLQNPVVFYTYILFCMKTNRRPLDLSFSLEGLHFNILLYRSPFQPLKSQDFEVRIEVLYDLFSLCLSYISITYFGSFDTFSPKPTVPH